MTADEGLAAASRVVDCEWKAANRNDDDRYTVSELANRVMGICLVERTKARRAFHLSPNDAEAELHDFKQAVEIVENVRKSKAKSF